MLLNAPNCGFTRCNLLEYISLNNVAVLASISPLMIMKPSLKLKIPSPWRVRNIIEWLEDGLDRSSNAQVIKLVLLFSCLAAAITVSPYLAKVLIDELEIRKS